MLLKPVIDYHFLTTKQMRHKQSTETASTSGHSQHMVASIKLIAFIQSLIRQASESPGTQMGFKSTVITCDTALRKQFSHVKSTSTFPIAGE